MAAGHNYYWSETWAIADFNLTTRSAQFRNDPVRKTPLFAPFIY